MMDNNILTIQKFYTAFQQKDYATMNSCYTDDIPFHDPVFGILYGKETKAMWQMLCTNAKDFSLKFDNIQTDDNEYYTCEWVASYKFSKTNRRIVNQCKAFMRMKDGVILEHSDAFNYYRWCRQAFGLIGLLFGWSGFMHKKISTGAKKQLFKYMKQQGL
ncbi:MAG: nuclear transport factor 2 family protein [Chitinophagaceae bacterium]|nr:nuclear transport factor 2 family protein [Chitinophagaceae bacterium]MCW5906086.1 nuclear transport factor 2 family protein [Chitinophagaceae bacterium]